MSFAHLPLELQLMIITLALHTPQTQASFSSTSATIDVHQATLLSLVWHSCRAIIVDMLYTHIRITRPSALLQLHRTLKQRPNIAAVVRSIHLGPEEQLPDKGWWEDDKDRYGSAGGEPSRCINSTLVEESVLPSCWKPGRSINIKWPGGTEARLAIGDAVYAALQDIDREPWRRRFSWSGSRIGVREWTARLMQVQAAFDLYLMEMRRVEDAHNSKMAMKALASGIAHDMHETAAKTPSQDDSGSEDDSGYLSEDVERYPSLEILLDASTPPPSRQERPAAHADEWDFFLTGTQIWQHLTRQGGLADNFDHLVLLTRSSRRTLHMGVKEWRRVRKDLGGRLPCRFEDSEWQYFRRDKKGDNEDEEDSMEYYDDPYESPSEDEDTFPRWVEDDDSAYEQQPGRDALDGPLNTVEILIDTATSLLSLTPNLVNLCVTSFLYRALHGLQNPEKLRWIVIGPRMRYWDDVLPDGPSKFSTLSKLRIVGKLSRRDATKIAREMPLLEEVEWESPQEFISAINVYANITRLQGQRDLPSPAQGDQNALGKRRRQESPSSSDIGESKASPDDELAPTRPPRRTLVLLHPKIVEKVFATMVPKQEVRTAWQEGLPLSDTLHPVKVVATHFEAPPKPKAPYSELARELAALYGDARRWWDEGKRYARS